MFIRVDAAPVVASRLANDTASCNATAGTSGIGIADRTDRGARERDRRRLREHEPDDQPRPARGAQGGEQVGEAPDLPEDHPEREHEGDDHHDVEGLDATELDGLDERFVGGGDERGGQAGEQVLVGRVRRAGSRG